MEGEVQRLTPALPWESYFEPERQHEFSSPPDLFVKSLNRKFLAFVEERLEAFQREVVSGTHPPRYIVYEYFSPDDNARLSALFAAYGTVGKHGLSAMLQGLLEWRTAARARKADLTSTPATRGDLKTIKPFLDDVIAVSVDFLFCKLVLSVLGTHEKEKNPLDPDVAKELEKACFQYFEANKGLVQGTSKETGALADSKRHVFELFGEMLGELSIHRFVPITERLFKTLEESRNAKDQSSAIGLIYAMRSLRLDITGAKRLKMSLEFVEQIRDNYFDPKHKKQLKQIQLALFEMLASVLTPVIDMTPNASKDDLYTDWLDGCVDLHKKVDAYSKKVKNKEVSLYPLQTVILCVGPTDYLDAQLPPLLERLIKCAKPGEKLKGVALECLYRILLASMVRKEKQDHVDFCRKVAGRIFPTDPKRAKEHVIASPEDCVDVIVDIIHLMAIHDLSFVSRDVILPLLRDRPSSFPDRTVVAFLAFNAIVDRLGLYAQSSSKAPGSASNAEVSLSRRPLRREATQTGFLGKDFRKDTLRRRCRRSQMLHKEIDDDGAEVGDFVREVSKALDPALADLDALFGSFLLIDPKFAQKDILELIGKDKGGQRLAYHTVLAALRRTHPTKMSALDLASILSRYALHVDPVVRSESFAALQHMVKHQPSLRLTVVEEFAKFTASIPYIFDEHITAALGRLSQLLVLWQDLVTSAGMQSHRNKQDGLELSSKFSEAEVEGTAIVYLCSGNPVVREAALKVLQSVATLNDALKKWHSSAATVPKLLIQSLKDHAASVVQASRTDPTRIAPVVAGLFGPASLSSAGNAAFTTGDGSSPFGAVEKLITTPTPESQIAWTRGLGRLVQAALPDAPDSISVALRHIVTRLPSVQFAIERSSKGQTQSAEADSLLISWRNYSTVACAACAACGGSTDQESTSSHHLFTAILPFLKLTPPLADALILALSYVHSAAYAVLFDVLDAYEQEVYATLKTKGRPKDNILRLRYHLALITRLAATKLEGHPFDDSPTLLQHLFEWIRQTKAYLETVPTDSTAGAQGLRYDFFVVVWSVLNELHHSQSEQLHELFPPIVRAQLYEFAMRYSGHVPAYFNEMNLKAAKSDEEAVTDPAAAQFKTQQVNRYVEQSALRAMGATLLGGGFYEVEVEQERNGPLFGWFTECFLSGNEDVRQIAKYAITTYIDANPEHDDELFNICTDLCYSKESNVGRGYFEAAAHIVMGRDINYSLPAIINMCLLKFGNPQPVVRSIAMAVLSHVTNSLKYEIAPIPAVSHTSNALQFKISSLLAEDYPQLASDLFLSVWHRITTTEDRSAHVQMLYFLSPWMHHIDISTYPKDKAATFLQNLSVLTTRYGTEHADILENVWAALIRTHGSVNLPIILDFLINSAVQTRNEGFLPTARQIAVCIARVAGEDSVEYLAQQIYETTPVSLPHDPKPDEADADRATNDEGEDQGGPSGEEESSNESWDFERVFPVNTRTIHMLSRSDICLILLIELSIEHIKEVNKFLARVIHVSFMGLDSNNPVIHKHARELVTNIVHSLASANGGVGSQPQALELIRQLNVLPPGTVWVNEDTSITNLDPASAAQLSEWVHSLVKALPFCPTLLDDWATEALTWAAKIGRVPAHFVYRSFQIYRALVPLGCTLTEEAVTTILVILYKHEAKRPPTKIGLAIDIMQVFLVLIKYKPGTELMKHPSIFWATASILYTDYPEEFLYAMRVLTAWLQRVEIEKKDVASALAATAPNDKSAPFLGLQMLGIKGLMNSQTEVATRSLLLLLLTVSSAQLVEPHANPRRRYLTALIGLIPWMVSSFTAARAEVSQAQEALAKALAQAELGALSTTIKTFDTAFADDEAFFASLGEGIAKAFFPAEEEYVVTLLVEMLRLGNPVFRPAIIQLLRYLLQHVNWDTSVLKMQDVALFNPLLSYPAPEQTLPLFALLLSRIPVPVDIAKSDHIGIVERMCDFDKPSRTWASGDKGQNFISNGMFAVVNELEGAQNKLPKPPKSNPFVHRQQDVGQKFAPAISPRDREGIKRDNSFLGTNSSRGGTSKGKSGGGGGSKKGSEKKKKDKKKKKKELPSMVFSTSDNSD